MAEARQNQAGTLPKNIRQIGTNVGNTRIYLEDYVYTYLHQTEELEEWNRRGFVLLGRLERDREYARYFISGMIRLKDGFFREGVLEFDDATWAFIYQEMKKYYDNLEIVGWGQDVSGASASLTAELERVHKQNFNIQKNVLFLLEHIEGEEAFYIFEKNMLQRREGYYVYYEKNPQMQEYMIRNRKTGQELDVSVDLPQGSVTPSYRDVLLDKKGRVAVSRWNGVLYTTSMLLVLAVCVLGVSTVSNVEKMQNLENTVSWMTDQVENENRKNSSSDSLPAMSQNTSDQAQDQDTETDHDSATSSVGVMADLQAENLTGGQNSRIDDAQDSQKPDDDATEQLISDSVTPDMSDAASEAQAYLLQGYYIVQKGDNLVSISKKIYGTSGKAAKIGELNGIDDMDKIYVGQKLQLP